jgi:hypothetical protein
MDIKGPSSTDTSIINNYHIKDKMSCASSSLVTIFILIGCLASLIHSHGESGGNYTEEEVPEQQHVEEECQDYDISWFIKQYDRRLITKPYFHIGVNISLQEAINSKHWEFRYLLKNAHVNKLTPKNVCKEAKGVSQHAQLIGQACRWNYTCDYNPHRFPAYIFHAHCINSHWIAHDPSSHPPITPKHCRPVYYPVPILYSTGCNPLTSKKKWEWRQEPISVACV